MNQPGALRRCAHRRSLAPKMRRRVHA